jgi:hypothetical protein
VLFGPAVLVWRSLPLRIKRSIHRAVPRRASRQPRRTSAAKAPFWSEMRAGLRYTSSWLGLVTILRAGLLALERSEEAISVQRVLGEPPNGPMIQVDQRRFRLHENSYSSPILWQVTMPSR